MTKASTEPDDSLDSVRLTFSVRLYLVRVYAVLALCILAAAVGCVAVLVLAPWVPSWPATMWIVSSVLFGIGCWWLNVTPKEATGKRYAITMATSASAGLMLAIFVGPALDTDPSIILTAFVMTMAVMVCFSFAVLIAPQEGMWLYIVASLIIVVVLAVVNAVLVVLNFFIQSSTLATVSLFLGVAAYCLMVLMQTECIILKASEGDMDALNDALTILMHLVQIFIRILIILTQCAKRNNDRESKPLLGESAA